MKPTPSFALFRLSAGLFTALVLSAVGVRAADAGYRLVPDFPRLPADLRLGPVSAVDLDAQGRLFVFHRGKPPILVLTAAGQLAATFGKGLFDSTHGLRFDAEGNVWTTDNKNHTVVKLSPAGDVLLKLGERNVKGVDAAHFDRPTDVAFAVNGDVFIADGYGNSRVVKFDRHGRYLLEWGRRGKGPGEFHLPHAIRLDSKGRVYVGDRENNRVQVFDQQGGYLREFGGFAPYGLFITAEDLLFVADGRANEVIKMTLEGRVLARWGAFGSEPGNFNMPHGIAVGDDGAVYVSEINGKRLQKFVPR